MANILIIEDEAAIRRVLTKILTEESADYTVSEAEDGLSGIEMIKKEDFDFIFPKERHILAQKSKVRVYKKCL